MGPRPILVLKKMQIFDTHAHLLDAAFDADREVVIGKIKEAGVNYAIEACCKFNDFEPILQLATAYSCILPTAGIHPEEINPHDAFDPSWIVKAAQMHKLYAIGEIGLDYHFEDMCPKDTQKEYFDVQLSIAEQYKLPVLIHDRDAHGDCMDVLRAYKGKICGIMHCFSGSWEMAKECIDIGLHLGFGGAITFKNAKKNRAVLAKMPLSRIVFETDCPYMAPEPFRGSRNDSSLIPYIICAAAAIRNEDIESLSASVYENSIKLFGLNLSAF